MIDTKERILETAERSFAENGYAATSLRSIIGEAGVNLAAVHYHFGSKEELLKAVILRRAEPVNAKRLALLDRCEKSRPDLERVLEAFIAPTFEVTTQPGGLQFVRLMGRMYAETDMLPQIIGSEFRVMLMRFHDAFRRALPDLAPDELLRRLFFGVGAMAHTLRAFGTPGLMFLAGDVPSVQGPLIQFLAAGLRAPVHVLEEK